MLGLIGPNGAGKSTLMECLGGVLSADDGTVRIRGVAYAPAARHAAVFYLPDAIAPWSDQRVAWVLEFHAALHGVAAAAAPVRAALGLDALLARRLGALSKGQRKRVMLALAIATPHPVLLLDEPFDGLDIRQSREAAHLLRSIAAGGRAVVTSIHSMTMAERCCDRLVLLNEGRTIAEGTLDDLRARCALPTASLEEVFLALA